MMRTLDTTALVLVIVGGLNWLLIGLLEFDLVAWLLGGTGSVLTRLVYVLVGLAALWMLWGLVMTRTRRPVAA